uniref:NADH-ubiquinone oxidoreductase chain 3 n=1 Tax=Gigantolina magna TaxID=99403 RepID=R4I289_9CEST|nr:NADH dehydrogenase subunit 3 [Gigantolina magna]
MGLFLIFVFLVCIIGFFCSGLFGLSSLNNIVWGSPFECGYVSTTFSLNNFSLSYFSLLVFFVLFDLEVSLLLNMPLQFSWYKNYIFYWVFLFFVFFGFIVEVVLGYVSWNRWSIVWSYC